MLTSKSLKMLAALFLIGTTSVAAQMCDSCDGGCSLDGGSTFGYPASRVSARGANHGHFKQNREAWKAEAEKIALRNDAWPKPFNCQDRMAYYSVWHTMMNQGYANHCVLGADHFESDTNELNSAGKIKIASIMQNIPSDRRQLLVVRDQNERISQARITNVNEVVQTYYGQSAGSMMIALTDLQPSVFSGSEADTIIKQRLQGLPPAIIPIVSAGAGIQSSASQ